MTRSCMVKIIKEILELINNLDMFAGYKINIQNSVIHLYTGNEISKNEIKKTI